MCRPARRAACLLLRRAWYRLAGLCVASIVRIRLYTFRSVMVALMLLSELHMYGVMSRLGFMLLSPVVVRPQVLEME